MKKIFAMTITMVVLLAFGTSKIATGSSMLFSVAVPLNTGYDHSTFSLYPNPGSISSVQDKYWMNIASYPPTSPNVAPSFAIQKHASWQPPQSIIISGFTVGSHWISARNTNASAPGTSEQKPSYTIFRKCFCLQPGFKEAQLKFNVRADDNIQVWLNTQVNQVLAPVFGNPNGTTPLSASTKKGFREGRNCLYVLLEDTFFGSMGFNLVGEVSAYGGLVEQPAQGDPPVDSPCCSQPKPGGATGNIGLLTRTTDENQQVVQELIKIAEARRLAKGGGK